MKKKVMDEQERKAQMQLQALEIKQRLHRMTSKILVMSGKGGVGKSSVAAHLAVALAKRGYRVGLMDVDLHGPSIPRILGLKGNIRPGGQSGKMMPVKYLPNMEVMSIEVLMENKDDATIWRGPLKGAVIKQFIADIEWTDLDYMVIDSPPGTGDEPLTVAQTVSDARALIVTTPQEVSLADVRKSIRFCRQVNMQILGLVENMSGLKCPYCGREIDLFKRRGGELTAQRENLNLLGTLPIEPEVVQSGDAGTMAVLANGRLPFTQAFEKIVNQIENVIRAETDPAGDVKTGERGERSDGKRVLAVPVAGGRLSPHFGHCEQFAFIETQDGNIKSTKMRVPPTHEPGVLPGWLHEQGADVAIVGGMGERAQELLRQHGIEVVIGAPADDAESLAHQYLANTLAAGNNTCSR